MTSHAKNVDRLNDSDFAIPETRDYPINTRGRAVSALARVAVDGTPAERSRVRAAVKEHYPDLPSSQGKGTSQAAGFHRRSTRRAGGK